MIIRYATPAEISDWNTRILANPDGGNIFQGVEFAEQKQQAGWTPRYVVTGELSLTILEKSIIGLGKFWYLPKGPGIVSTTELANLLPALRTFAAKTGVFVVKIEPEIIASDDTLRELIDMDILSVTPIQPNHSTVNVDLSESLDNILKNLNQKGRHAINRATRDGVTAEAVASTDANCQIMYRLLADTAAGSFRIRSYDYYRSFWQHYTKAGIGQLFLAYVDGQIVAGAFALVFGTKSTYKDGASIRERTAYGASHLLQWTVIEWAKSRGALTHDLCGTPPANEITNADHPYYGLGRFKTSFNKHVTDYVGAYDLVIKPTPYRIWSSVGERLALRIHSKRFNENWY